MSVQLHRHIAAWYPDMSLNADQEAGALVPYLLGQCANGTWSFAIDASAYGQQQHLQDIAKQKGKCVYQPIQPHIPLKP